MGSYAEPDDRLGIDPSLAPGKDCRNRAAKVCDHMPTWLD